MLRFKTLLAVIAVLILAAPLYAENYPQTVEPASDAATVVPQNQINVNTAKVRELMKVKGINATKARAIVVYRKKHGNFRSIDTLAKVKGFTKMKATDLKAIQDQLTI